METIQLIYNGNQFIGFYVIRTLVLTVLGEKEEGSHCVKSVT